MPRVRPSLTWIDEQLGAGIESAVRSHHRRRLRAAGWEQALDPAAGLWCEGDPPPRRGCRVEVLVDGDEALARIADELRGARSDVLLAGWHFDPAFRLERDGPPLRELLAGLDAEVRLLMWAGAPLPLFRPSRSDVRETSLAFERGTRIRCALDSRERPLHCHHEKAIVVDGHVAFVGGIDLTALAGNRLDAQQHPPRGTIGWHDVATRLEGPIVGDVFDHLRLRWHEVTGERLAAIDVPAAGETEAQLVRTVPEQVYDGLPRGDFRILEAYTRALRSAERLIYLESQFLWSPEIAEILAAKLRSPPADDFRVVVLLPSKPNSGNDDSKGQVAVLVDADGGAGRFLACTLYQHGLGDPVYVHAKVGIVDDRWLTIGSANLNDHSLFNDSELNVVTCDPRLARETRLRLWAEHLEREDVDGEPHDVVDRIWKPLAEEGRERRGRGEPLTHRLARLPHVSSRSRRLLGPIQSLLVDG